MHLYEESTTKAPKRRKCLCTQSKVLTFPYQTYRAKNFTFLGTLIFQSEENKGVTEKSEQSLEDRRENRKKYPKKEEGTKNKNPSYLEQQRSPSNEQFFLVV